MCKALVVAGFDTNRSPQAAKIWDKSMEWAFERLFAHLQLVIIIYLDTLVFAWG